MVNLARALAGALVFALPMLMTMEMWWLGFYIDRLRLALLLVIMLPLLVLLAHYIGFEATFGWREDLRDALVAVALAAVASATVLWLFGVIETDMPMHEIVGKIALQTVPASIGALLATGQLGGNREDVDEQEEGPTSYAGELFFMAVGALFLSLNVAPTEEMVQIAYRMEPLQELMLALLSLVGMHGLVYGVGFRGQEPRPEGAGFWALFLHFSVVGYAIVLLISTYVLWTFGRLDGVSLGEVLSTIIVLSFPGAIGAAGARLLL
jgi:putative integral membrane protein (TIGR02587 family)